MNYQELIAKALEGTNVLAMSKKLGVPHPTLNRYIKGDRLPDFDTALKLVEEADVDPGEAFKALAEAQREHKAKQFKLQMGFVQTQAVALLAAGSSILNLYIMSNKVQKRKTIYTV